MLFGLFILKQNETYGFYLWPSHTRHLTAAIPHVFGKLIFYLKFLLWDQGRWLWLIIIVASGILVLRHVNIRTLVKQQETRNSFLSLSVVATITYLLFSSLSFKLWRYSLPILPFVLYISVIGLTRIYRHSKVIALALVPLMMVIPFFYMTSKTFWYDNDMSYLRAIEAEKKALKYMVDNDIYVRGKFSTNMPLLYATLDHRFGFLPDSLEPLSSSPISDSTRFAVALTPGTSLENPNNFPLTLVHEEFVYDIKISVYRVEQDSIKQ